MASTRLVLITGATGRVGSALRDRLSDTDVELRVLSHDESKAQSLRNRGVDVIQGDSSSLRPWVRRWIRSRRYF
jgi:uncharacterized protein YbjT (DUF2867 family)